MGPGVSSLIGSGIHLLVQRGVHLSRCTLKEQIELLESAIKEKLERLPDSQKRGILPLDGNYRTIAARSLAAATFWADAGKTNDWAMETIKDNSNTCDSFKRVNYRERLPIAASNSAILVEEPLSSKRWRLEGQADLIRKELGSILIIDFKSGRIVGENGEILNDIALQMHSYALMAAERWPGLEIRLHVQGREDVEVPNNMMGRRRVEEILIELEAKFPYGKVLNAVETARTGPGCRYCQIRPICKTYLHSATAEWARIMPARERISSSDIWGHYVDFDNVFGAILIETPGKRMAKIFGFQAEKIDKLKPGSFIGAFGCKPQSNRAGGRNIHHPINWSIRRHDRELAGVRLFLRPS